MGQCDCHETVSLQAISAIPALPLPASQPLDSVVDDDPCACDRLMNRNTSRALAAVIILYAAVVAISGAGLYLARTPSAAEKPVTQFSAEGSASSIKKTDRTADRITQPATNAKPVQFYWFRIGEKASLEIEASVDLLPFLRGVVGMADVEMVGLTNLGNRKTYHSVLKAYSHPSISGIYNLNDTFFTWFDCEDMKTLRIQKKVSEGDWKDFVTNEFFSAYGYGIYRTKSTPAEGLRYPMQTNSCDIVTLIYLLRTVDKSVPLEIHWVADQGQSRKLRIMFLESPDIQISIHGQKTRARVVIARDSQSGVQIYLAKDYDYLPVKVIIPSFKVAGFSINLTANIRDYNPGMKVSRKAGETLTPEATAPLVGFQK